MTTLAPLGPPGPDTSVARFALPGRSWWLIRVDQPPRRVDDIIVEYVARSGGRTGSSWVMELRGGRGGVQYVCSAPGLTVADGGHTRAVLGPFGADAVVEALDRAETAHVSVLLLLVDRGQIPAMVERLRDGVGFVPGCEPDVVLTIDHDHSVAAIGLLAAGPPQLPGALVLGAIEPWPASARLAAGPGHAQGRGPSRRTAVAMVLTAASLAVISSWVGLRGGHTPPSPPDPPAVSGAPGATLPEPRDNPSIAFDAAARNVLLFGGGEPAGTTWLWSKQSWDQAVLRTAPSDRFGSAMAYDPLLKKVLLFGGREISGGVPTDTWAWDGRTWSRLAASGHGPPGYEISGMAWDPTHQQMVLVTPSPDPASGDAATWTWSGSGWIRRLTPLSPPSPAPTIAFDPATGTVLLVTNGPVEGAPSTTWSWDGATWRHLTPLHSPLGPTFMTAVPGTQTLLLVAATDPHTWIWDGRDWTVRQASLPSGSSIAGIAGDEASGAVIAFGSGNSGPVSAAWAWSGQQWERETMTVPTPPVAAAIQHPPPRQFASTAYDERRQQLVLFGGVAGAPASATPGPDVYDTDTWIFDGQTWSRTPTSTHPPTTGSMAFDPVTGSVILVADANGPGFTAPGPARPVTIGPGFAPASWVKPVTWSWDGSEWRQLHPASELTLGTVPIAMVTDPGTRTVLAVATCCRQSSDAIQPPQSLSTWVWDARGWHDTHPRAQFDSASVRLAYDTTSRRVLATVSDGSANHTSTTWLWDGRTWSRLHPSREAVVDPVTAVTAGDPSTGATILLERTLLDTNGDNAGGTVLWNGSTWSGRFDLALPQADTAYGDAALYYDPGVGRLVVLSSTSHDFSQRWMWTGVGWLQLAMG